MTRIPRGLRPLVPILGLVAAAIVPAAAIGAPLPGDNFEADDGNLAVTTGGNLDWNVVNPTVLMDLPSANDDSFTIGSQEDNPAASWGTTIAPVNAKADIQRVYMRAQFPYLDLGIVRNQQANGTVAYHVELNQSTQKHANGLPVRTVGDALVVYDFHGNDTTATLTIHRWIAAGTCATNTAAPCWGTGATLDTTTAIGANNTAAVTDAVVNPSQSLAAKTFDELAVNLTSALGLQENQCIDFGQIWLKTREGHAFGSALQDLVGPFPISVGNCDVRIEKDVVAVDGEDADNPASVPFGSTLTYRVRVSLGPDSANVPLSELTVRDTTLSDTSLQDVELVPVRVIGVIVGDDGDELLEKNEKWQYELVAASGPVTQDADACEDVVNSVHVDVAGGDTNIANNTATRTTSVVCQPDLVIDKTAPESVDFGGTVTYGVSVSHAPGSDPLAIPVDSVMDTLGSNAPVGLVLAGGDTNGDEKLDPQETWIYKATAQDPFETTATSCEDIVNSVTLTAAGDINADNNSDSVTTSVVCHPDLIIDKSADVPSVDFGGTVTYTIAVQHAPGSDPLAIPVDSVMDTLGADAPVGLVLRTGDDSNDNGLLDPGEVWHYQATAETPFSAVANGCGPLVNTATLVAAGDTNAENNTSGVTTPVVCTLDVGLTKTADRDAYAPGQAITYTVTVTNNGQAAIPFGEIEVVDPTLPGLSPVDPPAVLESGQSIVYTGSREVTIADCGQVANTATVRLLVDGEQVAETDPLNNTASVTVPVNCTMDVAVAKSADKAVYAPGDSIAYAVTVTNAGQLPIPFGAIQVSDPTLPGLALDGVAPQALAPGASLVYRGSRTVAASDCGTVTNTATVALVGELQAEVSVANNTASVTVSVDGAACQVIVGNPNTTLRIVKIGPKKSKVRRGVRYLIIVKNTGGTTAKNVVLVDPIPRGMVMVKRPKNAKLVKGSIRWNIGDLAPGRARGFAVILRTDINRTRTRCNIASVSASNAARVKARACTRFSRIAAAARIPVVTG